MTAPLTPPDCDLRDFEFMKLDVRRLLKSDTWLEAASDPRLGHALMTLWAECWHQVPAASLPNNERILARLAMCEDAEWARIRDRALAGWVLCADGRLYHPVIAEKAMEAYERQGEFRETMRNRSERQSRWRETTRRLSADLRALGITPPAGAKLSVLEQLLERAKGSGRQSVDAYVDASVDAYVDGPVDAYGVAVRISEMPKRVESRDSSVTNVTGVAAPAEPPAVTALPDWRERLFRQGLASVRQLTGKNEGAARSLVGRWLRDARDDARRVLRAIEDAQEQQVAEPVAWIEAALRGRPAQRSDSMAFLNARA